MRTVKYQKYYTKYIVKSNLLFYGYMIIFCVFFLIVTHKLQIEEHHEYEGTVMEDVVQIEINKEAKLLDNKIYIYMDKNHQIFTYEVKEVDYKNGTMYITLTEKQDKFIGKVKVEVIDRKTSLFYKIFMKGGK